MAKRRSDETSVQRFQPSVQLPDYLKGYQEEDHSLDVVKQHRTLSRLKIVHGTSRQEIKDLFGEGDVYVPAGKILVSPRIEGILRSEPFDVVPVGFFNEFCKWSDRADSDAPAILERTFDPSHELAKRAKDPKTRSEIYPGEEQKQKPKRYRYVDHLVFIVIMYSPDHPLRGEPFALSFEKGEYGQGKNFINAIAMRKSMLWSQVWTLNSAFRDRGENKKWWGFDFKNPEAPFIKVDEVDFFRDIHSEFETFVENRRIVVDREEDKDDEHEPGSSEKEF